MKLPVSLSWRELGDNQPPPPETEGVRAGRSEITEVSSECSWAQVSVSCLSMEDTQPATWVTGDVCVL